MTEVVEESFLYRKDKCSVTFQFRIKITERGYDRGL